MSGHSNVVSMWSLCGGMYAGHGARHGRGKLFVDMKVASFAICNGGKSNLEMYLTSPADFRGGQDSVVLNMIIVITKSSHNLTEHNFQLNVNKSVFP